MKMLIAAAVAAITLPTSAATPAPAADEPGFHARLYERYCERLRESPQAYVLFVRRMKPIHGFTYSDFAPRPGEPARADCKVGPERLAAVRQALEPAKR